MECSGDTTVGQGFLGVQLTSLGLNEGPREGGRGRDGDVSHYRREHFQSGHDGREGEYPGDGEYVQYNE
jgi:hypothetical protein